jgi:hypothetical protein
MIRNTSILILIGLMLGAALAVASTPILERFAARLVAAPPSQAAEKAPAAAEVKSAEALLEAAKTAYEGYGQRARFDPSEAANDPERFYRWSRRWLEAERLLGDTKQKRLAAYTGHLERMRTLEAARQEAVKHGLASKVDLAAVRFYRVEAEQWLAAAKKDG